MKEINIITRADGSQVKIVAELFTGPSMNHTIGNFVMRRANASEDWILCKDRSTRPWTSVDDYVAHGRPEMLQVASIGEILKTNQALMARVHQH